VTEPTVSDVHDLERVLQLAAHFGVPARVVVNRADLNLERIVQESNAPVIARIPFDRNVNAALMAGKAVVEHGKGPAAEAMHEAWNALRQELERSGR